MNNDRSFPRRAGAAARVVLTLGVLFLLTPVQEADAVALRGHTILIPNLEGELVGGEVTFDLPKKVRIGDTTYQICQTDKSLCGRTHTCTLNPQLSSNPATQGNVTVLLRTHRGTKLGAVSAGSVTRGAGWLLLEAGCDGDPATVDAFQGDTAAIFADVAIIASQTMASNHGHPDGISIKDELRTRFQIDNCRDRVEFKILDFHGFQVNNRGGSAGGVASAKVQILFRKSC